MCGTETAAKKKEIAMNNKPIKLLLLAVLFMATAGVIIYSGSATDMFATENVKIQKDGDGIWRIRDKDGKNKGKMMVSKKDKINWQAHGSAMEFRFHKDVSAYFTFDNGMFADGKTQSIPNNKKLRVTLKSDAPQDTLVYDVYVVEADTFVVGNSPPKLIIR